MPPEMCVSKYLSDAPVPFWSCGSYDETEGGLIIQLDELSRLRSSEHIIDNQ